MLLSLLMLAACEPVGPLPGQPDLPGTDGTGRLRVSPEALDFGARSVIGDGPATAELTVSNAGRGPLVIAGLNWVVGSAAFSTDAPALLELAPQASRTLTVTFDPVTDGVEEALLFPNGEVRVDLRGEGRAPVARLLSGPPLDPVLVGCVGRWELALLNDGSEDLEIGALRLTGGEDFDLQGTLPERLAPGQQARFEVVFRPTSGGPRALTVEVLTNDPASPTLRAPAEVLGLPGPRVSEVFAYLPESRADLLLVVDRDAARMADHLEPARDAATRLFEALDAAAVEWQVAVVAPDHGCQATVDPFLHPGLYAQYRPEQAGLALAQALTPVDASPGTLLDRALLAAEEAQPGGCLDGLVRDADQLHVVLVSSQTDASLTTASTILARFLQETSSPEALRISALTGRGDQPGCEPGGAARELARASGGLDLDLCALDWAEAWEDLARVSAGAAGDPARLVLAERPVEATLELRHEGRLLSAWSFDEAANHVLLSGQDEDLALGAEVEVTYLEALACEG